MSKQTPSRLHHLYWEWFLSWLLVYFWITHSYRIFDTHHCSSCLRWNALRARSSVLVRPQHPALYIKIGFTKLLYKRNRRYLFTRCFRVHILLKLFIAAVAKIFRLCTSLLSPSNVPNFFVFLHFSFSTFSLFKVYLSKVKFDIRHFKFDNHS